MNQTLTSPEGERSSNNTFTMRIQTFEGNDSTDWRSRYKVSIEIGDKVTQLSFSDGEPEDANLSRDFNDVYLIPMLVQMAYSAGWQRNSMNIINEKLAEDEY